jgi:hypothetical protein
VYHHSPRRFIVSVIKSRRITRRGLVARMEYENLAKYCDWKT